MSTSLIIDNTYTCIMAPREENKKSGYRKVLNICIYNGTCGQQLGILTAANPSSLEQKKQNNNFFWCR